MLFTLSGLEINTSLPACLHVNVAAQNESLNSNWHPNGSTINQTLRLLIGTLSWYTPVQTRSVCLNLTKANTTRKSMPSFRSHLILKKFNTAQRNKWLSKRSKRPKKWNRNLKTRIKRFKKAKRKKNWLLKKKLKERKRQTKIDKKGKNKNRRRKKLKKIANRCNRR